MLGSLIENVEGVEENETISNKGEYLDELCATGWTFKAKRFQKTITNYSDIQMSRRNFDRRSARKDSWTSRSNDHFWFLFRIVFGANILQLHSLNLSRAKVFLPLVAIINFTDSRYNSQYEICWKFSELLSYYYEKSCKPSTEEQHSLPRKRKRLNYSSLQYIEGHQSAEDRYSVTVKNHYRSIYYEASDAIAQAIVTRFDPPNFKA